MFELSSETSVLLILKSILLRYFLFFLWLFNDVIVSFCCSDTFLFAKILTLACINQSNYVHSRVLISLIMLFFKRSSIISVVHLSIPFVIKRKAMTPFENNDVDNDSFDCFTYEGSDARNLHLYYDGLAHCLDELEILIGYSNEDGSDEWKFRYWW